LREKLQGELQAEKQRAAELAAQLAEARNAVSQLRADCEQADNDIAHLEENLKIVESSFEEKTQKLAEAHRQMRLMEQRLKEKSAILDSLNLAVIMVNAHGDITYWNEGAAVFHAISAGEALGKKSDAIMKYKYASSTERKIAMESLQSTGRWDGKIRYASPDGEQKHADMFISRLNDEVGNSLGVLTILTDTTKRNVVEATHHAFKSRIEPMLQHAPVCIFSFDERGVITGLYGKSAELNKLNPAISQGKSIYELYGKYAVLLQAFRKTLSGEPSSATVSGKDGEVELMFAPIRQGDSIDGAVGVAFELRLAESRS
jgi:PAS domain S-box-containing protein